MEKKKIYNLAAISLLIAIVALMSFTPAGYLKIGPLSITFLTLPVIVGAATIGVWASTLLGLSFGITSFIQCFGMDAFGTALFQISAVKTAVMCIVPRVLMGLICGLIYMGLSKTKINENPIHYLITSLSAPLFNTLLFMPTLVLFFWKTDYIQQIASGLGAKTILAFFVGLVGVNGLVELGVCTVLGTLILIPLKKALKKLH